MFATLASYLFLIIMYVVNQKGVNAGKGDNGPSAKRMRMSTTAASSHHSDAQVCTYNTLAILLIFMFVTAPFTFIYNTPAIYWSWTNKIT